MITNINQYRKILESLTSDRTQRMKLDLLMQTAKEMIDAYDKAEAFKIAKTAKNEEIKQVLEELGTHSIVCKGVLIEIVGTFDNHSTNLTEYTKFVESSVEILGKQYKEMHDKMTEVSTKMSNGTEYLRFNKNPKNLDSGTMEGIGNIMQTVSNWITNLKSWFNNFLLKANEEINNIKQNLKYQTKNVITNNESIINENDNNSLVVEALKKASLLIDDAENEKYFLELAKIKEQQVIAMLNEFKAKKLAIDDKVLSLIKIESKPSLDKATYMNNMSNAEIVTESVADMAQNLFSLYTKSFQTSGSVRQYKDDSGLPEGTLGASFDWIIKQVVAPTTTSNENKIVDFVKNAIRKLKQYVSGFKIASKRADMALSEI